MLLAISFYPLVDFYFYLLFGLFLSSTLLYFIDGLSCITLTILYVYFYLRLSGVT